MKESTPISIELATRLVLVVVIIGAVLAGIPHLSDPLVGHHHIRLTETASIARNFYEGSMNILYPQINWGGSGPGYIEEAFQLYAFLVALLYKLFGTHEALGRGLSLALYAGSIFVVFLLGRRLFDEIAAAGAAFFMAVAPLGRFAATSYQPDGLALFGTVLTIYLFLRWSDDGGEVAFWGSAAALAVAALTKPVSLSLGLPIAYLCYQKYGWRFIRVPRLWLYAAAVFAPVILWYAHAHNLWLQYGNTNGTWGQGFTMFGTLEIWLSPGFYRTMAKRVMNFMATPPGVVFLLLGVLLRPNLRTFLVYVWGVGFAISVLISANPQLIHDYYQLPAVPVVALLMGRAVSYLWDKPLLKDTFVPSKIGSKVLVLALAALVIPTSNRTTRNNLRYQTPDFQRELTFSQRLNELTPPGSLVIIGTQFSRGPGPAGPRCCRHREPDGRYLGHRPVELYLSHRKGWALHLEDWSLETIEYLRAKGAEYFASWYMEGFEEKRTLLEEMADNYTVVEQNDRWVIYRL